jgi:hypothetical protein
MSKQLKVTDKPLGHECWHATFEELAGNEVNPTDARAAVKCAAGGGVQSDDILMVSKFQERHPIPATEVAAPPLNVQEEIVVE